MTAPHQPGGPNPRLSEQGRAALDRLLGALDRLDGLLALPMTGAAEPADGVVIGRYRARRRLGEGRFGIVFAADDPSLGRCVALKVPQPFVVGDPNLSERFVREARAAARVDHPRAVPVLDSGIDGGLPYLVAALIDGPTLADWFAARGRPVDPLQAGRLLQLVAEAVHHAHDHGVLHCDLKPANILLDAPRPGEAGVPGLGVPRITDFGLAQVLEDEPTLSQAHLVAGTPVYMAPEQARGERRSLTGRADVYALGAILYELLTGRPPVAGSGNAAGDSPVPIRQINPRVPRDLEAVALRCLKPHPTDRYATAAALAEDLGRFLAGQPTAARPLGAFRQAWRFVRRNSVAVALALSILASGTAIPALATWYSGRIQIEAEARRRATADAERDRAGAAAADFATTLERIRQRRHAADPGWAAANRTDIRRVAAAPLAAEFLADLRTEAVAALTAVDLDPPRTLAPGFKAYDLAFRPDGRVIALGGWLPDDSGTCRVVLHDAATGAHLRTLTYATDPEWEDRYGKPNIDGCRSLVFSPDGRWLVLGTRSGWLVRWDTTAETPQPIRWRNGPPRMDPRCDHVVRLVFAPSGRVLLSSDDWRTVAWDANAGWAEVFVVGGPERLSFVARPARFGDTVYAATDDTTFAVAEDPPALNPVGPTATRSLAATFADELGLARWGTITTVAPTALASGRVLPPFTQPGHDQSEDGSVSDAAFSPDGGLLATTSEHLGHFKVWGTGTNRLLMSRTVGDGSLRLAFAPDGRTLGVCVSEGTQLYHVPASKLYRRIALQVYPHSDADVSPTGVLATCSLDRSNDLTHLRVWAEAAKPVVIDAPAGGWLTPGENNAYSVAVSPDGRTVAFASDLFVRVVSFPQGSSPLASIEVRNLRDLRFGPDGRLWITDRQGVTTWAQNAGANLVTREEADLHTLAVAPGRTRVLAGRSDGSVYQLAPTTPGSGPIRFPCFSSPVTALALSADEKLAVAGSADGKVRVFEIETGATVADLPAAHRNAVRTAAFGPGGWFVTGSRDRTVKVWEPHGSAVFTLVQSRPIRRVFVTPNGQTLTILAEGERVLWQWDLRHLRASLADFALAPRLP